MPDNDEYRFNFRLPRDEADAIKSLARRRRTNFNDTVRHAVRLMLACDAARANGFTVGAAGSPAALDTVFLIDP
jgi:hypothetical protein